MSIIGFFFFLVLQMFFATSILHVHLMQWDNEGLVEGAVCKCDQVWESIEPEKVRACPMLVVLLHVKKCNFHRSLSSSFFPLCVYHFLC